MSKISDRVSYLQGLAEGMEIDLESKTGRILKAMIDVLGDVPSRQATPAAVPAASPIQQTIGITR